MKTKRLRGHKNRWGEGKVHELVYDKANRQDFPLCGCHVYGEAVPSTTPVTCKLCLAVISGRRV